MRLSFWLVWSFALTFVPSGCTSTAQQGPSHESPFRETVVLAADILPQGIAIGDVSSTSALLWVRTNGPALVQAEWATLSTWETVSKMATVIAPVPRTTQLATTAETDYTLSIPLEGLLPATHYRYHVLIGSTGEAKVKAAAKGEFITLPDANTSVPVTFAWGADLGSQGRCRRGLSGYPIFDVMRRQDLDFFLFLGDTVIRCTAMIPVLLPQTRRALISKRQLYRSIARGTGINEEPIHFAGFSIWCRSMWCGTIMK